MLFSGAGPICSVWSPLPRGQPCPWHVILSWALLRACCLHCTEMSQGPSDGRSLHFGSLLCEVPSTPKRFLTCRKQVKILLWILVWMYVQVCKKKTQSEISNFQNLCILETVQCWPLLFTLDFFISETRLSLFDKWLWAFLCPSFQKVRAGLLSCGHKSLRCRRVCSCKRDQPGHIHEKALLHLTYIWYVSKTI